ncbi:hypothetical protein BVI1335_120045 [Burkholderia vietnamiensis]|nr:hypothetical protein BVI1335_120045 [Burkholderia vietnamiensis]
MRSGYARAYFCSVGFRLEAEASLAYRHAMRRGLFDVYPAWIVNDRTSHSAMPETLARRAEPVAGTEGVER